MYTPHLTASVQLLGSSLTGTNYEPSTELQATVADFHELEPSEQTISQNAFSGRLA